MIYLHTTVCTPRPHDPLVIAIKLLILHILQKNNNALKFANFSKNTLPYIIRGSVASVTPTSGVRVSAMLLYQFYYIKWYEIGMTSSGIKFEPNFVKIDHLVQKLKEGHRQRGDFISLLFPSESKVG
jgi:hypothetical protein